MADTTRITVTLPTEQVAELKKLTDNVSGSVAEAVARQLRHHVGANPIVEVSHARVNTARMRWALSRVRVEPVTEQTAGAAAELLEAAGLHGHEYAIDATVAEMALRQPGPVAVLTSDIDAMARLCGDRVRLVGI
ncbi:hypothetical protein [Streptomyces sp. enrichment culture]|uniref:hypothetical protein n=1 Tax=Streptomyces sp. enrichment culture TaxID=1795815 RepID=UPI003F57B7EE